MRLELSDLSSRANPKKVFFSPQDLALRGYSGFTRPPWNTGQDPWAIDRQDPDVMVSEN